MEKTSSSFFTSISRCWKPAQLFSGSKSSDLNWLTGSTCCCRFRHSDVRGDFPPSWYELELEHYSISSYLQVQIGVVLKLCHYEREQPGDDIFKTTLLQLSNLILSWISWLKLRKDCLFFYSTSVAISASLFHPVETQTFTSYLLITSLKLKEKWHQR